MELIHSITDLLPLRQQWRQQGHSVAMVATMGNLHAGHIALVKAARAQADKVIVTIFVNELQFNDPNDYNKYPRTLSEDIALLQAAQVDLLFNPTATVLYPEGIATHCKVIVPNIAELHCGKSRPGHFVGVATVVLKLFNLLTPDYSFWGEKDYQQTLVIRKLLQDFHLPYLMTIIPTERAADGLALSSRNRYLTETERAIAPHLFQMLKETKALLLAGERNYLMLMQQATDFLNSKGFITDYYHICDANTLLLADATTQQFRILAAAYLGAARLIDNIEV